MTRPPDEQTKDDARPFLDHLADLRAMLVRCVAALLIGMLVAIPFAPSVMRLLEAPLRQAGEDPETFLIGLDVIAPFMAAMRIVFVSGLLVSLPFIVIFVGAFVFLGSHVGSEGPC